MDDSLKRMWNILTPAGTNILEGDEVLIKSFLKGQNKDFDKLFRKNAKYTYHIINKAIKELEDKHNIPVRNYFTQKDVENLICQIWAKLFQDLKNFRFGSKFGTYLYTVTFRTAYKEIFRVIKNDKRIGIRLDLPIEKEDGSKRTPEFKSGYKNPREQAYQKERIDLLWKAFDALSENYKEIISSLYFCSNSYVESALLLKIPIGTVKSRQYRALNQLKENLKEIGYEEYL